METLRAPARPLTVDDDLADDIAREVAEEAGRKAGRTYWNAANFIAATASFEADAMDATAPKGWTATKTGKAIQNGRALHDAIAPEG
jgi:uncharacterized Ntn-hydrolase superfamily protein